MSRRRQQTASWNGTGAGPPRGRRRRHVGTESNAEQERPYLAAKSGKDRAYKAGWLKSARSREGVRGVRISEEGVQDNTLEGRGLAWIMLGRR